MLNILSLNDSDIRSICKDRIESLEYWLRRLIDDVLTKSYGDFFEYKDVKGNRLIRKSIVEAVESRQAADPKRYPRKIDAVLLDDAIDILCKEHLFHNHFKAPLYEAFPDGRAEARTFMSRLVAPRNSLAHANAISSRQAEQVMCYSNDIIESLKKYYQAEGKNQEFNVPLILKVTDSFGNVYMRSQQSRFWDEDIGKDLRDQKEFNLRPGDILWLEVEIDPSFDPVGYKVEWYFDGCESKCHSCKVVIPISIRQVGEIFEVGCNVVSGKEWHRLGHADDHLCFFYKVLPPI